LCRRGGEKKKKLMTADENGVHRAIKGISKKEKRGLQTTGNVKRRGDFPVLAQIEKRTPPHPAR